ncbi:cytochrome b/b6 domain-containing protein [Magnetovibrio blakemorei]|nr:cytochrome b/b6 domain-containing protein [Magnetovibrio blakemorei]
MSTAQHKNPTQNRPVKVWDLPTRVFHWTLVAMVLMGYLTGWVFPENTMGLHLWAGYITVSLLVFRLTWGAFGSEYARLETFTFHPVHILQHMKELATLRPVKHYIGHNPTGSLMVFGLLIVLSVITLSGLIMLGGEENQGPLAGVASYALGDVAKDVHEAFVILLLMMIVLHVGGVYMEIKLTGEKLVRAMITGLKSVPKNTPALKHRKARVLPATLTIAAFVGVVGSALWYLSTMPPSGLTYLPPNQAYESQCGDCHRPYHPSLLPAASWTKMMADLSDHFGEDASLDDATVAQITAYLVQYGSEAWDTEAANRFRIVDPAAPFQITKTPYWINKHEDIAPAIFKRKTVSVPSNCPACHTDDYSGRFDDQKIKIPEEK